MFEQRCDIGGKGWRSGGGIRQDKQRRRGGEQEEECRMYHLPMVHFYFIFPGEHWIVSANGCYAPCIVDLFPHLHKGY